ncbi:MAG: hypothetical protein NTZ98_25120 [Acidobacteria bacterium]|nr:hypothetical protein [Acidobacteriota bacterium]
MKDGLDKRSNVIPTTVLPLSATEGQKQTLPPGPTTMLFDSALTQKYA